MPIVVRCGACEVDLESGDESRHGRRRERLQEQPLRRIGLAPESSRA